MDAVANGVASLLPQPLPKSASFLDVAAVNGAPPKNVGASDRAPPVAPPLIRSKLGTVVNLLEGKKAIQEHENEIAEVVIVCEPEQASLMMGGLHPRGSLYERPVNIDSARAHHAEFRCVHVLALNVMPLSSQHGIEVHEVHLTPCWKVHAVRAMPRCLPQAGQPPCPHIHHAYVHAQWYTNVTVLVWQATRSSTLCAWPLHAADKDTYGACYVVAPGALSVCDIHAPCTTPACGWRGPCMSHSHLYAPPMRLLYELSINAITHMCMLLLVTEPIAPWKSTSWKYALNIISLTCRRVLREHGVKVLTVRDGFCVLHGACVNGGHDRVRRLDV